MKKAHLAGLERALHGRLLYARALVQAQFERALRLQRSRLQCVLCAHIVACLPWKVRFTTSSCCSRVSRTKCTAYPETRIVRLGYFSGCSIASSSISRFSTFTFM